MKKRFQICSFIICCFFLFTFTGYSQHIKVAFIGSDNTFGYKMANREKNNFPTQLQELLGAGYEVTNYAVNGTTLLSRGDYPYSNTREFKKAVEYKADIVFIELGSNDSKPINRPFFSEFKKDYKLLIDAFRKKSKSVRIVLLVPLPSFSKDSNTIFDPVIKSSLKPLIQEVAYETQSELIDLHTLFIEASSLFPDSVHLSSNGAAIVARRLYDLIMMKVGKRINLFNKLKEKKKFSSFYGFEMAEFNFNKRACILVKPKKTALGMPWIWRARFWGHQPQTDIALLERGFHLVYCDVAELFGNKESVEIWDRYYSYMRQLGLSEKVVLEGMSRGGVYVYNWALANPSKVACIYVDAPVLDLKSWPGGRGRGPGSKQDWDLFKAAYKLDEATANQFSNSPLDNAKRIASLGIPLLHVVGDDDEVVPVDENTGPFEKRILEAGGKIKVIHKPGIKHHPHSLKNPTPIVDFILRATGLKTNFAMLAMPAAEYRSGAGWIEGKDWWAQHHDIDSLLVVDGGPDIVFLGNSITQGIAGKRTSVTFKPGLSVFDSVFSKYKWVCAGISGDRTQHLLWRLQKGNYIKAGPRLIVVTIGVNNFNENDSPQEIVNGMMAIVSFIRSNLPETKIILSGLLPTGINKNSERRGIYDEIHLILLKQTSKEFYYLPLTEFFVQPDGSLSLNDFSSDGIHLVEGGYRKWALGLYPVVEKLLERN